MSFSLHIHEVLVVSDVPWAEMEKRLQSSKHERKASRNTRAAALEPVPQAAEALRREIPSRLQLHELVPPTPSGRHFGLCALCSA
jgi:hypothetical protein